MFKACLITAARFISAASCACVHCLSCGHVYLPLFPSKTACRCSGEQCNTVLALLRVKGRRLRHAAVRCGPCLTLDPLTSLSAQPDASFPNCRMHKLKGKWCWLQQTDYTICLLKSRIPRRPTEKLTLTETRYELALS